MKMRKDLLKGLNAEQMNAVISKNNRILCLAGAGSGKTTVLTRRTGYIFMSRVSPRNIACITFTRASGLEMKKRLVDIDEKKGKEIFCNTFHKFCMSILMKFGYLICFDKNFSIVDQEERNLILEDLSKKLKYKSNIKNVVKKIEQYHKYEYEAGIKERFLIDSYLNYLKENNECDIDLILYFAYYLLREFKEVENYYHDTYKYICIDEYQDNNDIQEMIIQKINPENLFVVGDDRQSIYGFRGSNVDHIISFETRYNNCEVTKLTTNYRSTQNIVDVSNKLIKNNKKQLAIEMKSLKYGQDINIISSKDIYEEIKNIILILTSLDDIKYRDMAIIARTNKELDIVEKSLDLYKIPYLRNKKVTVDRTLLNIISAIYNPKDNAKIYNMALLKINENTLRELKIKSLEKSVYLWDVIEDYDSKFAKDIIKIRSITDPVEAVKNIIKYFNLKNKEFIELVKEWVEEKELENNKNINTLIKDFYFLSEILSKKEDTDGINLSTVHGSKGLEWHTVAVIGLSEGNFPSSRVNIDIEEERRLAYVAFTRAKERLILSYYNTGLDYRGRSKELNISRFINEIK